MSEGAVLELPPEEYARIAPLMPRPGTAGHMTFVHALIEGNMRGAVFVDDLDAPRTALACSGSGFWFALGTADAGFARRAAPQIERHHILREEPGILWAATPELGAALASVFPEDHERDEFGHAPSRAAVARLEVPDGYRAAPMDEAMAASLDPARVDPWVVRVHGGPAAFARTSFGIALVDASGVAAFCAACAIGGGEAEVEIITDPNLRRRGLAAAAYDAFARECERRRLRPAWTCRSDNEPSLRLAASMGYPFLRRVRGFRVESSG